MPKNDIFGSIENNEFIKNLLGDSKKIFDDFLGLAQGKKIREGLEGTSGSSSSEGLKYSYLSAIEVTKFKELQLIPHYFSEMSDDIWENVYPICAYTLINMMKNEPNILRSVDIFDPNNIKLIEYAIEIMLLLHYDRYQGIILTDSGQFVHDVGRYFGYILLLTKAPKTFAAAQICNSLPINQVNKLNLNSSTSTQISEMHNSICQNGGPEPKPIIMEIAQRKLMNINENDFTKSRFNTIVLLQDGYFLTFNFSKNDGDTTSILNNGLSSDNNFYRFQYQDLFINYNNDLTKQVPWLEWFLNIKNMTSKYDLFTSTEIPTKKGISKQELKTILSNLLNKTDNEVNWLTNFTKYIYKVGGSTKYEQGNYNVFDINNFEPITESNLGTLCLNGEPQYIATYNDNWERQGFMNCDGCYYWAYGSTTNEKMRSCDKIAKEKGAKIFAIQCPNREGIQCFIPKSNQINSEYLKNIKNNPTQETVDSLNSMGSRQTNLYELKNSYPEVESIQWSTEEEVNCGNCHKGGIAPDGTHVGQCWSMALYETSMECNKGYSKLILNDDPTHEDFGLYISTEREKIFILKIKDHYSNITKEDLIPNPNWKENECKYQCDSNNIALESDNNNMLGIGGGKESIISKNQTIRVWLDLFGIWRFELSFNPNSQNFASIKQRVIEKMYGYKSSFSIQHGQFNSQSGFSEHTIYHTEPNRYRQDWEGVLAMEFKVIKPIFITYLGCFCNNGNYLNRDINVCICDTNSKIVAGPVTFLKNKNDYLKKDDNPNTLYQKFSTNVLLTEGTYTIRAQGYGPGEPNQNYGGHQNKNPIGGGGLIQFTGSYWSEPKLPINTPDLNLDGPPFPIRYYAGAFMYEKEEQPTVSQYEITDLFIYDPHKINGSRYNLSYMFNILKIYTTDPTSISEFAADADKNGNLYLKFQDPLSNDDTCYLYQINNDNKNCTEMQSVENAVILANDYAEYLSKYSSIIHNKSNSELSKYDIDLSYATISKENVDHIDNCIELCKNNDDCKFMTYNSAKTCKLYNNEIGKYIIGTNDNNIKTMAQDQSLYMKQCLPYETQDLGLINAGFITRDQTGGSYNMGIDSLNEQNCSTTDNLKNYLLTDPVFINFINNNYQELIPLLDDILFARQDIEAWSKKLLKDKNISIDNIIAQELQLLKFEEVIDEELLFFRFADLFQSSEQIQNRFNTILRVLKTTVHNKVSSPIMNDGINTSGDTLKALASHKSNFQNINEYNINDYTTNDSLNNIKYIIANNDILEKSQIFTNNINNIIKEIDKQSYLNKFNKSNNINIFNNKLNNKVDNNYKDNDNLKNIILLIFITIILVVILSLIKKR